MNRRQYLNLLKRINAQTKRAVAQLSKMKVKINGQ